MVEDDNSEIAFEPYDDFYGDIWKYIGWFGRSEK
jgi:hypothetical protein